jgi:hypothetical protein
VLTGERHRLARAEERRGGACCPRLLQGGDSGLDLLLAYAVRVLVDQGRLEWIVFCKVDSLL